MTARALQAPDELLPGEPEGPAMAVRDVEASHVKVDVDVRHVGVDAPPRFECFRSMTVDAPRGGASVVTTLPLASVVVRTFARNASSVQRPAAWTEWAETTVPYTTEWLTPAFLASVNPASTRERKSSTTVSKSFRMDSRCPS